MRIWKANASIFKALYIVFMNVDTLDNCVLPPRPPVPFPSISNLSLVPVTHPVYDLCWSLLLPLSLSIIILGNPVVATREEQLSKLATRGESRIARSIFRVSAGPVGRVGMAFLVGAVGSVAGVAASFYVVTTYAGGAFALSREAAAKIAGAVTATYVGGSVNLFAVASAVGLVGATSAGGASLLGALAAADIFLMSVYFSFLVAVHKTVVDSSSLVSEPLQGKSGLNQPGAGAATRRGWRGSFRSSTRNTLALTAIGSTICLFGNAVTDSSPLPGTSTMVITLLTVGATRLLTRFAPGFQASLSRTAPIVATVLLNAFFGSVGASGRLAEVVGVAPAIFVFTSVALAVHIAVMATGAAILNRCCGAGLGVDDLIVASNANIGGPSTAATFAGLLGKDELVVPAAVWGTVGYAIATTLGVGVWVTLR